MSILQPNKEYKLYELSICEKIIFGNISAEEVFYKKMKFNKCRIGLCTLFSFAYSDGKIIELFYCILNKNDFYGEIYGIEFNKFNDEYVFFIGYEHKEKISYLDMITHLRRAIRVFKDITTGLKSDLDVYFMIRNMQR